MTPDAATQIRWGVGAAILAVALVAILALVPDPFFRQRVIATTLDDVEGVSPGVQVYFRGAPIGQVRSVELDGPSRTFAVHMGVAKDWRPSPCAFATVAAANPLTAPRIELVALETATAQCANARRAYGCDPVAGPQRADAIAGCRRPADLFETASVAIGEAAAVARTANAMAQRLSTMLQGDGSGSAVDMAKVARNATETLAALNSLSTQLDRSFRPGRVTSRSPSPMSARRPGAHPKSTSLRSTAYCAKPRRWWRRTRPASPGCWPKGRAAPAKHG